jgi:hypothetical protein
MLLPLFHFLTANSHAPGPSNFKTEYNSSDTTRKSPRQDRKHTEVVLLVARFWDLMGSAEQRLCKASSTNGKTLVPSSLSLLVYLNGGHGGLAGRACPIRLCAKLKQYQTLVDIHICGPLFDNHLRQSHIDIRMRQSHISLVDHHMHVCHGVYNPWSFA